MIDGGERQGARTRTYVGSIVASIAINVAVWLSYTQLAYHHSAPPQQAVVVRMLRFEHRRVVRPSVPHPPPRVTRKPIPIIAPAPVVRPRRRPPPRLKPVRPRVHSAPLDGSGAPSMSFGHHQGVKLKMPGAYDTQDLANGAAADVSKFVDFSKAKGAFVPQVWLVNLKTSYLSGPTLQDAVHDIVASLEPDGAKISASKPQRVCHGRYAAWFLSYSQPTQDLPGQYENILFLVGDKMYRIMYSRPLGQPEDLKARAAMNGLCPA